MASLEERIRALVEPDAPDWIHTKAIQISRLMDEIEDPQALEIFVILSHLQTLRTLQALESERVSMHQWAEQINQFGDNITESVSKLIKQIGREDDNGF